MVSNNLPSPSDRLHHLTSSTVPCPVSIARTYFQEVVTHHSSKSTPVNNPHNQSLSYPRCSTSHANSLHPKLLFSHLRINPLMAVTTVLHAHPQRRQLTNGFIFVDRSQYRQIWMTLTRLRLSDYLANALI